MRVRLLLTSMEEAADVECIASASEIGNIVFWGSPMQSFEPQNYPRQLARLSKYRKRK